MSQLKHRARHLLHKATPKHIIGRQSTARVFRRFAHDLGLVYFGFVDQQDDEHRLLRGMTVSTSHRDHYYSVGTFRGYDIALAVRRDTLKYPDKRLKDHHWTIVTVDLHSSYELPNLYIGHTNIREQLLARYSNLTQLNLGQYRTEPYPERFMREYSVYGLMTHAQFIELLLQPKMTEIIAERFDGMSIELHENTVYLYSPTKHPNRSLLERMVNGGLWLADALDKRVYGE